MQTRDAYGRFAYDDDRMCQCGHVYAEHRDNDPASTRCDSPEDQSCRCAGFRPRVFATHRQLTGAAYIHHAYVCDGNKVVMACSHRHGERRVHDPITGDVIRQGAVTARACAEKMLRKYLKRIRKVA
jgi:hypothetical protein